MVSPAGSLVSPNPNLDKIEQPNVNLNRFHTLKSAISSLAVIETTRLVACMGVAFFGYTSKLIPAALCLTIATIACILKNRVTKLDVKNPEEGQVSKPLTRSVSIISRISNKSNGIRFSEPLHYMAPIEEKPPKSIKETFLSSIEDRVDNKPQWHDLLAICYLVLCGKKDEMPNYLNGSGSAKKATEPYLADKIKKRATQGTGAIKKLKMQTDTYSEEDIYDLGKLTEDQSIITQATPFEIMEIVQELYTNISNSESNQKLKAYFSKKADHAKEHADQLKIFETTYFAKDSSQVG